MAQGTGTDTAELGYRQSSTHAAWDNTGNDNAYFAGTGGNVTLGSTVTVNSLTFDSFSGDYTLAGSQTLTLNGGLTMTASAGAVTISNPLALGAYQAWLNSSANALTVSGIISGAGGLILSGTGVLTLSGANAYTGLTAINSGTLTLSGNRIANSGSIIVNGGVLNIGSGSFSLGTVAFYAGNGSSTSIVNQTGGSFRFTGASGQLLVGNASGPGIYNLSGGTLTGLARLAWRHDLRATGYNGYIQSQQHRLSEHERSSAGGRACRFSGQQLHSIFYSK